MTDAIASLASGKLLKIIPDPYVKWEAESQRFYHE